MLPLRRPLASLSHHTSPKPLSYSATLSTAPKTNQPSGRPLFLWFKDRGKKLGRYTYLERSSGVRHLQGRGVCKIDGRDHAPRRVEKPGRSKTSTSSSSWQGLGGLEYWCGFITRWKGQARLCFWHENSVVSNDCSATPLALRDKLSFVRRCCQA